MTLLSLPSSKHVVSTCGGTKLSPLSHPSFRHIVSACDGGTKLSLLSQPTHSPQLQASDGQALSPLSQTLSVTSNKGTHNFIDVNVY